MSKHPISLITIILCSCAITLSAAENDFGDLKYFEKANPHRDISASIAKSDLRFIALMGYAIYIPGVDDYYENYASYGYRVIEGSSDAIQNYEQGRLIQIARYYAATYNRELLAHLEALKAKNIAETIAGYANAKIQFEIESVTTGNINMLPYSLHAVLTLNSSSCVNHAWWFDPISNDKPDYDWNQFIAIFNETDQVLGGWRSETPQPWTPAQARHRSHLPTPTQGTTVTTALLRPSSSHKDSDTRECIE